MTKNGWFQKQMKDDKGELRLFNVLYENGKIKTKRLVEVKNIKKEKTIRQKQSEISYDSLAALQNQLPKFVKNNYLNNISIEFEDGQYKVKAIPEGYLFTGGKQLAVITKKDWDDAEINVQNMFKVDRPDPEDVIIAKNKMRYMESDIFNNLYNQIQKYDEAHEILKDKPDTKILISTSDFPGLYDKGTVFVYNELSNEYKYNDKYGNTKFLRLGGNEPEDLMVYNPKIYF